MRPSQIQYLSNIIFMPLTEYPLGTKRTSKILKDIQVDIGLSYGLG